MTTRAGDLTPVTSEAQLRVGLQVKLVKCNRCGRPEHVFIITSTARAEWPKHWHGDPTTLCPGTPWRTAPGCQAPEARCFERAIREQRLFIVETGLDVDKERVASRPVPERRPAPAGKAAP